MIIGWGLNTTSTLDPSQDAELSIPSPKDLSLALGLLIDDIVWSSWSCTVGRDSSTNSFFIWGFHPSALHPSYTLPTKLNFPSSLVPKTFVGRESLEAVLGEDGVIYVPREEGSEGDDWVASLSSTSNSSDSSPPRFRDVAVLGTGEWLGIRDLNPSTIHSSPTLASLLSIPLNSSPSHPFPNLQTLLPSSSHALVLSSSLPDASSSHPIFGLGSNLHSQLSLSLSTLSQPTPASKPIPLLTDLLSGGQITFASSSSFSTSGVYSSAVSEMGQLYVWGGRWGVSEEAVDIFEGLEEEGEGGEDEDEEEGREITCAAVCSTGGVVCVTRDGRVWRSRGSRVEEEEGVEGLLPKLRIEKAATRPKDEREFEEIDLRRFGIEKGGGEGKRVVKKVVVASGGRGFLLACSD